jgi:predicted TIM-barrel fold metal-dependent hydrolase
MFDHNWDEQGLRPIIESCIEVFGPDRCMFGSNFPVDKLHKTYDDVWRAYAAIARQYSDDEQVRLFRETAAEFYRL